MQSEYGFTVSDGKCFPFNPSDRNVCCVETAKDSARDFLRANTQYPSAEVFRLDFKGNELVDDAIVCEISRSEIDAEQV